MWVIGAVANVIILVAYSMIFLSIAKGLKRSKQTPRENPLGWATAALFLSCALHHGHHPFHTLLPLLSSDPHSVEVGLAFRHAFEHWNFLLTDIIGALVALWYWSLRTRFPALVRGAGLFEDLRERQKQALTIHDNIVQGLAVAKLNLETGNSEEGMEAIEDTLRASRSIITELLGDQGSELALHPGDFRRSRAASL